MTDGSTQTVAVPGGAIAVRERGAGVPVVFVHGAGGDGHNWDGVVERLEGHRRCVVVDRAGYGDSRWEAPEWPTRSDHGAHLLAVRGSLALDGAVAVGTSGGAITVLEALRADRDAFAGAVLIEPPVRVRRPGEPEPEAMARPAPDPAQSMEERGIASIRRLDAPAWDGMGDENRKRYIDSFPTMLRETSSGGHAIDAAELAEITLPALLVYGDATPEQLITLTSALAAALPRARPHVVHGAAHLMYLTHTDEVTQMIDEFVNEVTTPERRGSAAGGARKEQR